MTKKLKPLGKKKHQISNKGKKLNRGKMGHEHGMRGSTVLEPATRRDSLRLEKEREREAWSASFSVLGLGTAEGSSLVVAVWMVVASGIGSVG